MIEAEDGAESKALANELADAVRAAVPRTEELQ
jgi:hypothetical protein